MTEKDDPKSPRRSKPINSYAQYSSIAFQMIAIIGLGTYGGIQLDKAFPNTHSIYTIICIFAAVCLSMYFVIKQTQKISKSKKTKHD